MTSASCSVPMWSRWSSSRALATTADCERLRRLVYGVEFVAVEGPADYERAAELYRLCRRGGETPRKLTSA